MFHEKNVPCLCRQYGLHIDTTIRPHVGTVNLDVCFAGNQPSFRFYLRLVLWWSESQAGEDMVESVGTWFPHLLLRGRFLNWTKMLRIFLPIVLAVLISGGLMPIGNSKPLTFDPPRPPCASRTTVAPKWHVPHRERFGMVPQAPICRHAWKWYPRPRKKEPWWVIKKLLKICFFGQFILGQDPVGNL